MESCSRAEAMRDGPWPLTAWQRFEGGWSREEAGRGRVAALRSWSEPGTLWRPRCPGLGGGAGGCPRRGSGRSRGPEAGGLAAQGTEAARAGHCRPSHCTEAETEPRRGWAGPPVAMLAAGPGTSPRAPLPAPATRPGHSDLLGFARACAVPPGLQRGWGGRSTLDSSPAQMARERGSVPFQVGEARSPPLGSSRVGGRVNAACCPSLHLDPARTRGHRALLLPLLRAVT